MKQLNDDIAEENPRSIQYVRMKQLAAPNGLLPVGKSTIWAWTAAGIFPQPIRLSRRMTVWRVDEVLSHMERMRNRI